ncbi:uncharacterized protein BDV14DRAFT_194711 [Aspergillus stella-maris]|uniref:uncharacterized protein n=1 Tax=Aspergillus stella-maris TaxID=1810926 RepID=UPI003CCE4EAD
MPSRYSAVHKNPKGPGDDRPTALGIVKDNNLVNALAGKIAIVTGASSGIGIETAKALKATGMHVYAAVRDLEKAKRALGDALEPGKLDMLHLDLSSLASVRSFAAAFFARETTLHVLVNNAGIMATPKGRTVNGFEMQFGTNHLAHFLLFVLLRDCMLAGATDAFPARVVAVSSTAHRYGRIELDNLNLEGVYDPDRAYGQAKCANIWFATHVDRLYAPRIRAFSVHPGGIWTGLHQFLPQDKLSDWKHDLYLMSQMKSAEQGAATTVYAALDRELDGTGGLYLEDCGISGPVEPGYTLLDPGYEEFAFDEEGEQMLWRRSLELVGAPLD